MRQNELIKCTISRNHNRFVLVVIGLIFVALLAFVLLYYRFHFMWFLYERRGGSQSFVPIPDDPMPVVVVPEEWVLCRVGRMKFMLPFDLAKNRVDPASREGYVIFRVGLKSVYIASPTSPSEVLQFPRSSLSAVLGESTYWTLPRIKLECYRADTAHFQWAMSQSQVRRHALILALCQLVRSGEESFARVEYILDDNVDATALFGNDRVILDWESKTDAIGGYVRFIDLEENSDWNWVRVFCRSISVSLSDEVSEEFPVK